jgi:hypothetical protein
MCGRKGYEDAGMAYSGVAVVFRYTVSIVSRLDMKCNHTRSSLLAVLHRDASSSRGASPPCHRRATAAKHRICINYNDKTIHAST